MKELIEKIKKDLETMKEYDNKLVTEIDTAVKDRISIAGSIEYAQTMLKELETKNEENKNDSKSKNKISELKNK